MDNIKLNGWNNNITPFDGVGGRPNPFLEGIKEDLNNKNMEKVGLKSSAIIRKDELNNIWYSSDVEVVLGKIEKNGKFNPYVNNLFTAEMLNAIATLMNTEKVSKN